MINEDKIKQLLTAFYNGDTTSEEEILLLRFFNSENVGEKWHIDRDMFNVLYDPSKIPLPKKISERLENVIDKHIAETALQENRSPLKIKKIFIGITGIAATILLCIGLFFISDKHPQSHIIADTYTNPEEAAVAAEKALMLVSTKLNKGLSPLEKAKESVNKTNELLNENFKLN